MLMENRFLPAVLIALLLILQGQIWLGKGGVPTVIELENKIKEQNELYQIGRTKAGKIVTNAKGGQSYHNYGMAFDLVLIIDGKQASWDTLKDFDGDKVSDWLECVEIAKSYGWEWGGDWAKFKDQPHFQKTFGKSIAELLVAPKFIQDNIEYPVI